MKPISSVCVAVCVFYQIYLWTEYNILSRKLAIAPYSVNPPHSFIFHPILKIKKPMHSRERVLSEYEATTRMHQTSNALCLLEAAC